MKTKAILFDLDGTLLDTAPDLIAAVNHIRKMKNLHEIALSELIPYAAVGVAAILKAALNITPYDEDFIKIRTIFLEFYLENIATSTKPFDGILELLEHLSQQSIPWGIVTNKSFQFSEPLIAKMAFANPPACIVSGDSLPVAKPHPEPLLHACKLIGVDVDEVMYIGDTEVDTLAAKAANMFMVVAEYGYLGPNAKPASWHANAYIKHPKDIIALL